MVFSRSKLTLKFALKLMKLFPAGNECVETAGINEVMNECLIQLIKSQRLKIWQKSTSRSVLPCAAPIGAAAPVGLAMGGGGGGGGGTGGEGGG